MKNTMRSLSEIIFGETGKTKAHVAIEKDDVKELSKLSLEENPQESMDLLSWAFGNSSYGCSEFLLQRGKNPCRLTKEDPISPLGIAIAGGKFEYVRMCAEKFKVDWNAAAYEGNAPLHVAVIHNQLAIANYLLLQKKVDINSTNRMGCSALMLAADENNEAMVRLLLKHGARKNIANKVGMDALIMAKRNNNEDILKLLSN